MSGPDRRRLIIEAARSLFAQHGYNGTPVRAIAKAAGVSEALLYKHFPSKEDLYSEIIGYAADLKTVVTDRLEKLEPGTETLVIYAYTTIRLILFDVPGRKEEQYWHERLLFRSLMGDSRYAKSHFKSIREIVGVPIEESIKAATEAGDMVAMFAKPMTRYWFLHHLAMALNLCHLMDEPAFEYEGAMDELAMQAVAFGLRGMGMKDEAILNYCRIERLEPVFRSLYPEEFEDRRVVNIR